MDAYNNIAITKDILKFAIPATLSALLSVVAILVNMRNVGMHSQGSLYILAMFLPINYFLISIYETNRASALALTARWHKNINQKESWIYIGSLLAISALVIVISFCVVSILQHELVKFFHVDIAYQAVFITFSKNMLLLGILVCASYIFIAVFYASDRPLVALVLSIFSTLLHCIFTYLLAFYYGQGISGYVYATLISYSIVSITAFILLRKYNTANPDYIKGNYFNLNILKNIKVIGLPIWLSYAVLFCSLFLINKILANFGTYVVTGFGVAYRVQSLVIIPAIAMGSAIALVINNATHIESTISVNRIVRVGIAVSLLIYGFLALLTYIYRVPLISAVTNIYAVKRAAIDYLSVISPSYMGIGPFLTFVTTLEQIGYGTFGLTLNAIYFTGAIFIGEKLSALYMDYHWFYQNMAILNFLGLFMVLICVYGYRWPSNIKKIRSDA